MLYVFSSDFIQDNKDYFDEIIKDTLKDVLYAITVYAIFIALGFFVV